MRHGRHARPRRALPVAGVAWVGEMMGAAYPEIVAEQARIQEVVRHEEERFAETLDQGLRRIEDGWRARARRRAPGAATGSFLFTLYDTYGFPRRPRRGDRCASNGWRSTERRAGLDRGDGGPARARARRRRRSDAADGDRGAPVSSGAVRRDSRRCVRRLRVAHRAGPHPGAWWPAARRAVRRPPPATRSRSSSTARRSTPSRAVRSATRRDRCVGRRGAARSLDTYYRGAEAHRASRARAAAGGFREGEDVAVDHRSRRADSGCASTTPARTCCTPRSARCSARTCAQAGSLVAPDHLRFDFTHGEPIKAERARADRADW